MNSNNSGSGFMSGYTGGFLGMNRNQQNSRGCLGITGTYHQNQNSNPAGFHNDQVHQSMKNKSVVEVDGSVGQREMRDSPRGFSMTFGKEKVAGLCDLTNYGTINTDENSSDEDELNLEEGDGKHIEEGKGKKEAPWQRMKWTDQIVRFLIQVVASVGEDGTLEGADNARRKSGLIRKGKWKTVSKVLILKGFHVSPQQCEDKFNDLNKRYKKLNDILGRGTCAVVENPALLDNMHNLSTKAKEDVMKLLSSKHLFYREMCAFHNGQKIPDCSDTGLPLRSVSLAEPNSKGHDDSPAGVKSSKEKDDSPVMAQNSRYINVSGGEAAGDNDDSEDDESEDEDPNDACARNVEKMGKYGGKDMINGEYGTFKSRSGGLDDFRAEMAAIFNDPSKSQLERREWIRKRTFQLHEERICIQANALDIEKQRSKWRRFCNKKELELETSKLEKERLMAENEHEALVLKRKEMEVEFQGAEATLSPTPFSTDVVRGKEQTGLGKKQ